MKYAFEGPLAKMTTHLAEPVEYKLGHLNLNSLLGHPIAISFLGEIQCIQCYRKTTKSFQSGFCFPCFRALQTCGLCIIHPERCRYPEGICDPTDWVHKSCGLPHIVYLANTALIKVGVTRETQIPTRWIDQGAVQAIPLFRTNNRYLAGQIEVFLKQFFSDKTLWQAMLKNQLLSQNLSLIRDQFFLDKKQVIQEMIEQLAPNDIEILTNEKPTSIVYPVIQYPQKIKAFHFDKTPEIKGKLLGIKGQYLLLDSGVLNVRKFGGYQVRFVIGEAQ